MSGLVTTEKIKSLLNRVMYEFNLKKPKIEGKERWIFILISDRKQIYGLHLDTSGTLTRKVREGDIPPKRPRKMDEIIVTIDSDIFENIVEKRIDVMQAFNNKVLVVDANLPDMMLMKGIL